MISESPFYKRRTHKVLTYQFNILYTNVIISFDRAFACIIVCVVAVHFFEIEVTSGTVTPFIYFSLIHPGIYRNVCGAQNFDSISFPSHSWVRISITITNNAKIIFPTVQLNWMIWLDSTSIEARNRKIYRKSRLLA